MPTNCDQRPTNAVLAFGVKIQRASRLLGIHERAQQGADAPPPPYSQLPRGAIVFAVGALEAHLAEVSAEVMVRDSQATLASNGATDVLKGIHSDLPTLALEVAVLPDHTSRVQRMSDAVAGPSHRTVHMHGTKAVSEAAGRVGGESADVWSALGSRGRTSAQTELDRWTTARHKIVHQGNQMVVLRPQARSCIEPIRGIAEGIDLAAQRSVTGSR